MYVRGELFLREIKEHGYPFQCKVGNPLLSASSTAIEEQGLLKDGVPSRKCFQLLSWKFGDGRLDCSAGSSGVQRQLQLLRNVNTCSHERM